MCLIVDNEDVLHAHQIGHQPLDHLAFGLHGVNVFAPEHAEGWESATKLHQSPRYRDRSRDDRDLKPIGYIVNNTVRVTVRKLSDVGSLIDKAVSAGATRVNRIRFELSDPAAARIQALKLAMKQAEHEARTLLSETPDNRLGKVLNIRTRGGHYAPKMERAVMSVARADTPIEGGTLGTRAEVTVSFEIVE